MKAMIDKNRFESIVNTVFTPFEEGPIRSFQIYSQKSIISKTEYTLNVYPTRITVSSSVIKNEAIATIADGKEKFIKDVEEFLVNLKATTDELAAEGIVDKFMVRTVDYDPRCYVTQEFDKFIELFIRAMNYFVIEE